MKTLDQTIEALSAFYNGLEIPEGEEPLLQCALHWLKIYRSERTHLIELHQDLVKENDNDPLTWEQLQQLEGKPVWIEYDDHKAGRRRTYFKCWEVADACFEEVFLVRSNWSYKRIEQGDVWQAYRKERK